MGDFVAEIGKVVIPITSARRCRTLRTSTPDCSDTIANHSPLLNCLAARKMVYSSKETQINTEAGIWPSADDY